MKSTFFLIAVFIVSTSFPAFADTYVYKANCKNSSSKQGEENEDLTKMKGKPIECDSVVISLFDNGHVLLQLTNKSSHLTPLGFSGSHLDYDSNPNFITLPLEKIYFQHATKPSEAEAVDHVQGYCFLTGKIEVGTVKEFSCASKIEIGTQKLTYHIDVDIIGHGERLTQNPDQTRSPLPLPSTAANNGINTSQNLSECLLSKAQYGHYSSYDGGKSAMQLSIDCAAESKAWINECMASGDIEANCNLKAVMLAQVAIKNFGK